MSTPYQPAHLHSIEDASSGDTEVEIGNKLSSGGLVILFKFLLYDLVCGVHRGEGSNIEYGGHLLGLDDPEDRVTGEDDTGVADLEGYLDGRNTGEDVGECGRTDNDRDYPNVETTKEGTHKLETRGVEKGNVIARV